MKYQLDLSEARKEGREEGQKEGRQEGWQESKKAISLKMRKKGYDYQTIAELNDISVDQVKAWEEEACYLI